MLSWLAFHAWESTAWFGSPWIIAVFLALCVLPIYPFLRAQRNLQRSISAAVLLAVGALIAEAVHIIGRFVMHTNSEWVAITGNLNKILLMSSLVVGMWAGYSKRKDS